MPANLHALIRYRTIDECLRKKGTIWGWKDLSEACGEKLRELVNTQMPDPSQRTITGDIERMRNGRLGFYAPIVYDPSEHGYYYEDADFSIAKTNISASDREHLAQALTIIKQYRGFNRLLDIEDVIRKMEHLWTQPTEKPRDIIHFDQLAAHPGEEWFDQIVKAVRSEKSLFLQYRPFDSPDPYWADISPYLLKEYNRRWFLVGYRHDPARMEVMGLERILNILPGKKPFFQLPGFSGALHFKHVIGTTVPHGKSPEQVYIRVKGVQAKYLETKPLHPSQQVLERTEEWTDFALELVPNYELESQLLALGERVVVLAPASLRERIQERLQWALQGYEQEDGG